MRGLIWVHISHLPSPSFPKLQAVAAAQRAGQDNRGAGADVHPDVAAAGVGAGGAGGRQRALHRRLGRPHPLRLAGVHHPHGRAELPQHAQPVRYCNSVIASN